MSMGYIPKKKLYLRRQRKLRKKYKNFSCATCDKGICAIPTPPFGAIMIRRVNCPNWKKKARL